MKELENNVEVVEETDLKLKGMINKVGAGFKKHSKKILIVGGGLLLFGAGYKLGGQSKDDDVEFDFYEEFGDETSEVVEASSEEN